MTFGNYILRLRRRLQDMRTISGDVITDISESGSRWSANELLDIANVTILEAVALIHNFGNDMLKQVANTGLVSKGTLSTVTDTGITTALPSYVIAVLSVENNEVPYSPISPTQYEEYSIADNRPRTAGTYFTTLLDLTTNERKIHILPKGNAVSLTYSFLYGKSDYGVAQANDPLFLYGIDNFLINLGEREARDREHNWQRSQILDARINSFLGIRTKE